MKRAYKVKRTERQVKKVSISKGKAMRKAVLCAFLLGGTIYLTWSGIQDLQTTAQLRLNIQENKDQIADLENEMKDLEKTYQNLSNPDYARYYSTKARLLSLKGEVREALVNIRYAQTLETPRQQDWMLRVAGYYRDECLIRLRASSSVKEADGKTWFLKEI